MATTIKAFAALAASLLVTAAPGAHGDENDPLPLKPVKDAPFGPATRRFDYASLDSETGLLFVADLAGGHVQVFDIRADRTIRSINGVPAVHGVLAVPELGRVYATATGADQVVAIDEKSLEIVGRAPAGHYPDGIAFDPAEKKLYVSDEHGNAVTVIDALTVRHLSEIPLGGEVGNSQYDAGSGLIYSNEQTHNVLVGIDPKTDHIVSRARLNGCEGAHGLLIEPVQRLAFIACEDNATLVTFSLARHAQVAVTPIGKDPDVLAYDSQTHRLYVAGESGVISVFDVNATGAQKLGQGFLADNAHVVAVDPASHRVFFPLRNVGGGAALRIMEPR